MSAMAFQITSLTIVYSSVYSGADQKNHQSSASLAFVRGIHRWPVNSHHKGPVTRKMLPFDDVIMSKAEEMNIATSDMFISSRSRWNMYWTTQELYMRFVVCRVLMWSGNSQLTHIFKIDFIIIGDAIAPVK